MNRSFTKEYWLLLLSLIHIEMCIRDSVDIVQYKAVLGRCQFV